MTMNISDKIEKELEQRCNQCRFNNAEDGCRCSDYYKCYEYLKKKGENDNAIRKFLPTI